MKRITILFFVIVLLASFSEISQAAQLKVRVVVEKANVRLKPTIESNIVAKLTLGTVIDLEGKSGNWYYVKLPKNQQGLIITGYIYANLVEEVITKFTRAKTKPSFLPVKPVQAQKQFWKALNFKAGGGFMLPSGELTEDLKTGFYLHVSGIHLLRPRINLIGGLELGNLPSKHEYRGDDYSLTIVTLFLDGRYTFISNPKVSFFAEAGLGIYDRIVSEGGDSDSEIGTGIRIGLGLVFNRIEVLGMLHKIKISELSISLLSLVVSYRF